MNLFDGQNLDFVFAAVSQLGHGLGSSQRVNVVLLISHFALGRNNCIAASIPYNL